MKMRQPGHDACRCLDEKRCHVVNDDDQSLVSKLAGCERAGWRRLWRRMWLDEKTRAGEQDPRKMEKHDSESCASSAFFAMRWRGT